MSSDRAFTAVDARFLAAATAARQLPPPTGIEIAFAGRSNVGKSSLLNALMARKNLARTSSTPGCTRQIAFFGVRLGDGLEVTLVDLPGYGFARRSKTERLAWAGLIEDYLLERPTLALVNVLVDARRGVESEEEELLELLAQPARTSRAALPALLVATKTDKLPASSRRKEVDQLRSRAGRPVFGASVREPSLIPNLWRRIRTLIGAEPAQLEAATDGSAAPVD